MKQLTGWHVFLMFGTGFATIIAVNMTLALNAVRSFPGLEVRNSYIASQAFEAERTAQEALNWDVTATLDGARLVLQFEQDGHLLRPEIVSAVFGRATSVAADQRPEFRFEHGVFSAQVDAVPGNWNLRLVALAEDGTRFQQRLIVSAAR